MRPYATVPPALFWAEHVGRQLRTLGRDHQVLALYLWTAPTSNQYGLYYLPIPQLCEEAGFTPASAAKVLDTLAALEFAFYHRSEQWVWVKTLAQTSLMPTGKLLPRTDNRLKGMHSWYATVPDNPYLGPFFDHYERMFFLPERRQWSGQHHYVEVTVSEQPPARQLAAVNGRGTLALSAPTSSGTLFPDAPGALVPVARSKPRGLVKRTNGAEYDPQFDRWFAAYPAHRQVEKRTAYQAWLKVRPAQNVEEWTERAVATLERQKRTRDWIKEGGRYVPKPEKYLERGKYEDRVIEGRYLSTEDVDRVGSSLEWGLRRDPDDPHE